MIKQKNIVTLALVFVMCCTLLIPCNAAEILEKDYPTVIFDSPISRSGVSGYTEGYEYYYGIKMTGSVRGSKTNGVATTDYPSNLHKKYVSLTVAYVNLNTGEELLYQGSDRYNTSTSPVSATWTRPSSAYEATKYISSHYVENNEGVMGIGLWLPL